MVALNDIRNKREQILHLAASYGARDIRVFGSVVRGEQTATSDLDLLVRMDDDSSLLDHIGLVQDLGDLLGCRVDVVNERVLYRGIRDRVLSEAVPL
jgi:uncharacterized protein